MVEIDNKVKFKKVMIFRYLIIVVSCSVLIGGQSCHRSGVSIGGKYRLDRHGNGLFYLRGGNNNGHADVGGVFDGVVKEIGWDDDKVIALVDRIYQGDRDGYYKLGISSGEVTMIDDPTLVVSGRFGFVPKDVNQIWNMKNK